MIYLTVHESIKLIIKELKFEYQDGKTKNISMQTQNVFLQEKEGPTPGATQIAGRKKN